MRRATALSLSTGHFTSNFAHFVLLCQQWAALSTATQARAHQDTPTTMFTQRFNPSTGEYEWAVVDITDETAPADCNDALLAATTYTDMLNDAARNRAFHRAITRVVQPGDLVLDIGTGTGLLAMLAARHMITHTSDVTTKADVTTSDPGHVLGCEVYHPMANMARRIVQENGLGDYVTVIDTRSTDLHVGPGGDLPHKADVIVSEILDSELLGEGLLGVLRDAHARLLKQGGRMIPARATLYGQLVHAPALRFLSPPADHTVPSCVPLDFTTLHDQGRIQPLSAPFVLFDFDFSNPPPGNRTAHVRVPVQEKQTVHGVVVWWRTALDPQGTVVLSTAPPWVTHEGVGDGAGGELEQCAQEWREHWKPCWYGNAHGVPVQAGTDVLVQAQHDDLTVSVVLEKSSDVHPHERECNSAYDMAQVYPPHTRALLQSKMDQATIASAMHAWFDKQNVTRLVLTGDLYRVLVESACMHKGRGLQEIIVLQASPVLASMWRSRLSGACTPHTTLRIVNTVADVGTLDNHNNNHTCDAMQGYCSALPQDTHLEQQQQEEEEETAVETHSLTTTTTMFAADPYYLHAEALPPWHHLFFWVQRDQLIQSGALADTAPPFPARGALYGMWARMPDFARAQATVHTVEGLDLSSSTVLLGGTGEGPRLLVLARQAWQVGRWDAVGEPVKVLEMDFAQPAGHATGTITRIPPDCDALITWMQFDLLGDGRYVIQHPPTKHAVSSVRQGIVMIPGHASSTSVLQCSIEQSSMQVVFDLVKKPA